MNLQKNEWGKFCNCRNSKCMKLYCECFAARMQCGKNCHCVDCHNRNNAEHLRPYKDYNNSERKTFKEELAREHKGCACRKSGCTKKYCECYQAGLLCREICKCIDCQNNESLSNKKVISQLKRTTSSTTNKGASLYPIILTQDNRHLNQILTDENPLNIKDEWIQQTAQELYKKAAEGSFGSLLSKLIDVLSQLQSECSFAQNDFCKQEILSKPVLRQQMRVEQQRFEENFERKNSSQMISQENEQSPMCQQNVKYEERMQD